jgi:hypothetical protein
MSAATGCVEGSWSCRYAQLFSTFAVLRGLRLAQDAGEGRERLVEPQVVPPPHGDEVAEPHVGHLVQHGLVAPLVEEAGDAAAEDVVLEERDGAGVLHRARVELRDEQLVVLAERVPDAEAAVVEVEALLGLGEQPFGVHVLGERGAAVDAERDGSPRRSNTVVDVLVAPLGVGPGHERYQVGAHDLGGGEAVDSGGTGPLDLRHGVRDDLPLRRRGDREGVAGLEVGLVEAGEHALAVGRLELGVEVDGAVHRVDEPVQALAGVHVAAGGLDDELVLGGQAGQRDPVVLAVAGDVERGAVQRRGRHLGAHEVDPAVRARLPAAEPDRRAGGEGRRAGPARAVGEVERHHVLGDLEQRGPSLGLDAGQVGRGHAVSGSFARVAVRAVPTARSNHEHPAAAGGIAARAGTPPGVRWLRAAARRVPLRPRSETP